MAQKCHEYAKIGSAFCQIRKKHSKICQKLVNFCQSGEISPNLVTLIGREKEGLKEKEARIKQTKGGETTAKMRKENAD